MERLFNKMVIVLIVMVTSVLSSLANVCHAELQPNVWLQKNQYKVVRDYYSFKTFDSYNDKSIGSFQITLPCSWSKVYIKDSGLFIGLVVFLRYNSNNYSWEFTSYSLGSEYCLLLLGNMYNVDQTKVLKYDSASHTKYFMGQVVKTPKQYDSFLVNKEWTNAADHHLLLQFNANHTGKCSYTRKLQFIVPAESASGTYSNGRYQSGGNNYTGGYTIHIDGDRNTAFTWTCKELDLKIKQTKDNSSVNAFLDEEELLAGVYRDPTTDKILVAQRKADIPHNHYVKKHKSSMQKSLESAEIPKGVFRLNVLTDNFLCISDTQSYYGYYVDNHSKIIEDSKTPNLDHYAQVAITPAFQTFVLYDGCYPQWQKAEEVEEDRLVLEEALKDIDKKDANILRNFYSKKANVQNLSQEQRRLVLNKCISCVQLLIEVNKSHDELQISLPQNAKQNYLKLYSTHAKMKAIDNVEALDREKQKLEQFKMLQEQYNNVTELNEQIITICDPKYSDIVKVWKPKFDQDTKPKKEIGDNISLLTALYVEEEKVVEYIILRQQCDSAYSEISSLCDKQYGDVMKVYKDKVKKMKFVPDVTNAETLDSDYLSLVEYAQYQKDMASYVQNRQIVDSLNKNIIGIIGTAKKVGKSYSVFYKSLPITWADGSDNFKSIEDVISSLHKVESVLDLKGAGTFEAPMKNVKTADQFKQVLGIQ